MRLNEVATQVKIIDGEGDKARSYYYWVTVAKPEKAMRAAKKKHRDRMSLSSQRKPLAWSQIRL